MNAQSVPTYSTITYIFVLVPEYIQLHLMFFIIVKYLPALPLVEVEMMNLEIPFGYSLVLERRKNGNENK